MKFRVSNYWIKRLAGESRGAAIVETSVVLLVLLTLLAGTVKFSGHMNEQTVLSEIVRDIGRLMSHRTQVYMNVDLSATPPTSGPLTTLEAEAQALMRTRLREVGLDPTEFNTLAILTKRALPRTPGFNYGTIARRRGFDLEAYLTLSIERISQSGGLSQSFGSLSVIKAPCTETLVKIDTLQEGGGTVFNNWDEYWIGVWSLPYHYNVGLSYNGFVFIPPRSLCRSIQIITS